MSTERVQKILAQAGIASRRKAEELITDGLVTINGQVAKLGDKADLSKDAIKVRGKLLSAVESPIYMAFYKPKGVISSLTDPEGRPSLSDFLSKIRKRVFPIGLLNFNSEGLLLLTNDGAVAEKIQKSDEIARVYEVKVAGKIDSEMLSRLERGMTIERKKTKPYSVRVIENLSSKTKVEIIFVGSSSMSMDIKTYFEMKGFLVDRIVRTAIGQIKIQDMKPGDYRYLEKSQLEAVYTQPELNLKRLEAAAERSKARSVKDLKIQEEQAAKRAAESKITPRKAIRPAAKASSEKGGKTAGRAGTASGLKKYFVSPQKEEGAFESRSPRSRPGSRPSRSSGTGAKSDSGQGRTRTPRAPSARGGASATRSAPRGRR